MLHYNTIDWTLLRQQKTYLIEMLGREPEHAEHLEGLLHFIDAVQDDAEGKGYPVFLPDEDGGLCKECGGELWNGAACADCVADGPIIVADSDVVLDRVFPELVRG